MCTAHQKRQRPAPRGPGCPQIGHLELEGKTNHGELWDACLPSVASAVAAEQRAGRPLNADAKIGAVRSIGAGEAGIVPTSLSPCLRNCAPSTSPTHRINTHSVPGPTDPTGEYFPTRSRCPRCALICSPQPLRATRNRTGLGFLSLQALLQHSPLIISSPFNSPTCHINYRLYLSVGEVSGHSQLSDIIAHFADI